MQFLVETKLSDAIREVLKEDAVDCAVAFWGSGAEQRFRDLRSQKVRIICNLGSGGTNPFVIEKLMAAIEIKQMNNLHAKVYIGKDRALVASANVSSNGLGLEGIEQAHWAEAGVEMRPPDEVRTWFNDLWSRASFIAPQDLIRAKQLWKLRQRLAKPPLTSLASFDTEASDLPLMTWRTAIPQLEAIPQAIEVEIGTVNPHLIEAVEDGMFLEGPEDNDVLKPNRWIFGWLMTKSGLPSRKGRLWWFRTGRRIPRALKYGPKGTVIDVVIAADRDTTPAPPFPTNDKVLSEALFNVLRRPEFKPFTVRDYEGIWFKPRLPLVRPLWRALREEYLRLVLSRGPATSS